MLSVILLLFSGVVKGELVGPTKKKKIYLSEVFPNTA